VVSPPPQGEALRVGGLPEEGQREAVPREAVPREAVPQVEALRAAERVGPEAGAWLLLRLGTTAWTRVATLG